MKEIVIKVNGMSCNHCKNALEKGLKTDKGVKDAVVNLLEKNVKIVMEDTVDINSLYAIIEDAGYEPVKS